MTSTHSPHARRIGILVAVCAAVAASVPTLGGTAHAAARFAPATVVVTKNMHFKITNIGPNSDTDCDVVGDLYTPSAASAAHPAPAILTTNGFGGSKDDQAAMAMTEAERGYVVLSYSGLGFGAMPTASPPEDGSTCQIEIDDPDWDGQAGKQLISFLGGEPGIGYTTYSETTKAYSGPVTDHDVLLDTHDHNPADAGKPDPYDPRVGMIGGSEGGEVQFAVADVDPRLDMIIPEITWNDLAFSLGPNNTSLPPHSDSYTTPGVLKLDWPVLFSAIGEEDGVDKDVTQPATLAGTGVCPNFDPQVCTALATSAGLGYPPSDASASDPVGSLSPSLDAVGFLRHRSVESYMANIRIPVLLAQGQADTLFELSEAATTFHALQAQGTPVKMIWQSWGHSDSTPVAGEDVLGDAGSPEGGMFQAWFDHYLKGENTDLGPTFSYYRDWDYHPGAATGAAAEPAARAAYASSPTYPVAPGVTYALSGTDALTSGTPVAGSSSFVAPPVVGASYTETSAIDQSTPVTDAPGTYASYTLPAFTTPVNVVGIPTATLHLTAPAATSAAGPGDELVLFLRLEDITPAGTVVLPHRLIAAFRTADLSKPVTVQLPGIVHQIPAGDQLRLVVAGSDLAFHGNNVPQPVTVATGPGAAASTLTVPILGATTAAPPATAPVAVAVATHAVPARGATRSDASGSLAFTGGNAWTPLAALVAVGGALVLRRVARRR
jgi:predicted acyl esterase